MTALSILGSDRLHDLCGDLVRRFVEFAESSEYFSAEHVIARLAIFDYVHPILSQYRHDRILEIGCAQGVHSALLSRFGRVWATDLEEPLAWMGDADSSRKAVFDALGEHPIEFKAFDGVELPYPGASFDVVFHNSVIEHVPDPVEFNRQVWRLLDDGGVCICITGTPALCRFRYRSWLLRLPQVAMRSVAREVAVACVPRWRDRGIVARLRAEISEPKSGSPPASLSPREARRCYARLRHFLHNPRHNRLVIEGMAKEHGTSVDDLLRALADWFEGSVFRRLGLLLTPPTHGQHYRDAADEKEQWEVDRWVRTFEEAGFEVERVSGYRYQQWLEWTRSPFFDARLFYFATKWIGRRARERDLDPERASEFILVARKTAKPALPEPPARAT